MTSNIVRFGALPPHRAPPAATPVLKRRLGLSEAKKREILAVIRAGARMTKTAVDFRQRIDDIASHIPDFDSLSELAVKGMYEAHHDIKQSGEGVLGNSNKNWQAVYRAWAKRNGDARIMVLKFKDYDGHYECFQAERPEIDWWERWIDIGLHNGVPMGVMTSLYFKHKEAPVKTVRAMPGKKAPVTAPSLPPDPQRKAELAPFQAMRKKDIAAKETTKKTSTKKQSTKKSAVTTKKSTVTTKQSACTSAAAPVS